MKKNKLIIDMLINRIEQLESTIKWNKQDIEYDRQEYSNQLALKDEKINGLISENHGLASKVKPFVSFKDLDDLRNDNWIRNNKIHAIRMIMNTTGKGLRESKEYLDSICSNIPVSDGE
jgi:hypothetical protein